MLFGIGANELRETVSILAADLVITPGEYAIVDRGTLTIDARIANTGSVVAEDVVVSAAWTPHAGSEGFAGSKPIAASIPRIAPGETHDVTLSMRISTGAYNITLTAATSSIEAFTRNNASAVPVGVEYALLAVEVESAEVTGYETDGGGIVELRVRVTNVGVAPTGPLTLGAECAPNAQTPCDVETMIDSISPADNPETVLSLVLPQGETALTVYAGANDDGYRWGERNVVTHSAIVPTKQPVELALAAGMEVAEYWSDGTANVDVDIMFRNDGYQPVTDKFVITVACYEHDKQETAPMADCGGVTSLELTDGFGPATDALTFRVPMGASLRASLPGGAQETANFTVPERILGVEREVWECFSDVPDETPIYDNDFFGGCGGWGAETIQKWAVDTPVHAWADPTGDQRYIDILHESLDELAPLLDLDIEWVASESDANLKAYVGVPSSRNADIGFDDYCQDAAGCGGPDSYGDAITAASLSVWLDEDDDRMGIKFITIHEILHAVTGVHHAPSPLSIIHSNPDLRLDRLSNFDVSLFELHAHPLVQPGMTNAEVGALIVFADELLDPPEGTQLDALGLVERAYAAVVDAGSARFRIGGKWGPIDCGSFGGWHGSGDLSTGAARIIQFEGGGANLIEAYVEDRGWRYWQERAGRWDTTTASAISDATEWRPGFTDPLYMLISVLRYADAADIEVSQARTGSLRFDVTLDNALVLPVNWASGVTIQVSITLDAETYEMSGYSMGWRFFGVGSGSCSTYDVTATAGEYGVDIPDPR